MAVPGLVRLYWEQMKNTDRTFTFFGTARFEEYA